MGDLVLFCKNWERIKNSSSHFLFCVCLEKTKTSCLWFEVRRWDYCIVLSWAKQQNCCKLHLSLTWNHPAGEQFYCKFRGFFSKMKFCKSPTFIEEWRAVSIYGQSVFIYGIPTLANIHEKSTHVHSTDLRAHKKRVLQSRVLVWFFFPVSMLALLEFPAPGCETIGSATWTP